MVMGPFGTNPVRIDNQGRHIAESDWVYVGDPRRGDERLVREVTTAETFEITGRGTVHIVHVGNGSDDLPHIGEEVLLDGQLRHVTAVEAHMSNPPKPTKDGYCGIMVTPRTARDVAVATAVACGVDPADVLAHFDSAEGDVRTPARQPSRRPSRWPCLGRAARRARRRLRWQ